MREDKSWRDSKTFLIFSLFILGPFSLIVIWLHRQPPFLMKMGLSMIVIFVSLILARFWMEGQIQLVESLPRGRSE